MGHFWRGINAKTRATEGSRASMTSILPANANAKQILTVKFATTNSHQLVDCAQLQRKICSKYSRKYEPGITVLLSRNTLTAWKSTHRSWLLTVWKWQCTHLTWRWMALTSLRMNTGSYRTNVLTCRTLASNASLSWSHSDHRRSIQRSVTCWRSLSETVSVPKN